MTKENLRQVLAGMGWSFTFNKKLFIEILQREDASLRAGHVTDKR